MHGGYLRGLARLSAVVVTLLTGSMVQGQCCGDCDGDGRIEVNELVQSVVRALDGCPFLFQCCGDCDSSNDISISELIQGVGKALNGCDFVVTPNPTARPTNTRSTPTLTRTSTPNATATPVPQATRTRTPVVFPTPLPRPPLDAIRTTGSQQWWIRSGPNTRRYRLTERCTEPHPIFGEIECLRGRNVDTGAAVKAYVASDLIFNTGNYDYLIIEPLSLADGCRTYLFSLYDDVPPTFDGILERTAMVDPQPPTCELPTLGSFFLVEGELRSS